MLPTRNVTVDFFGVVTPPNTDQFHHLLERAMQRGGDVAARSINYRGDFISLEAMNHSGAFYDGDLTRVRTDLPVTVGDAVGHFDVIATADDQGPFERTAFLYHATLRTLLLQRNRGGVSVATFGAYIELQGGLDAPIDFNILLQREAWSRVTKMEHITNFKVKVAGLASPAILKNQGYGVDHIGSLMEKLASPSIEISAKSKELNKSNVIGAAKRLLSISAKQAPEISKIEISGRDENDGKDFVDLITNRIVERVAVRRAPDKTLPYDGRRAALREAWQRRADEIKFLYSEASNEQSSD